MCLLHDHDLEQHLRGSLTESQGQRLVKKCFESIESLVGPSPKINYRMLRSQMTDESRRFLFRIYSIAGSGMEAKK